MKVINRIRQKILRSEFVFSDHTLFDKLKKHNFTLKDILAGISNGEIVEKQTHDLRGTKYVIIGNALDGREIEIVCRFRADNNLIIITVYEPNY